MLKASTDSNRPIALVGPTASGKSSLAIAFARANPKTELISADSMQVYQGMDIGTAKPSIAERAEIVHHLIDVVSPDEDYTVARFQHDVRTVMAEIVSRGSQPLLIGGTGLYLRAVIDNLEIPEQFATVRMDLEQEPDTSKLYGRLLELDPVAASRIVPTNRRRIVRALEVTLGSGRPFSSFGPGLETYPPTTWHIVGIDRPRAVLDRRIEERYSRQIEQGFLDEVARLLARPGGISRNARQALGYKEIADHLEGRCTLEQALELAIVRTRRFARRQQRWFRRDPRICWIEPDDGDGLNLLEAALANWNSVSQ